MANTISQMPSRRSAKHRPAAVPGRWAHRMTRWHGESPPPAEPDRARKKGADTAPAARRGRAAPRRRGQECAAGGKPDRAGCAAAARLGRERLDRAAEQAEASGQIGFHALALAEREQGQGEGCACAACGLCVERADRRTGGRQPHLPGCRAGQRREEGHGALCGLYIARLAQAVPAVGQHGGGKRAVLGEHVRVGRGRGAPVARAQQRGHHAPEKGGVCRRQIAGQRRGERGRIQGKAAARLVWRAWGKSGWQHIRHVAGVLAPQIQKAGWRAGRPRCRAPRRPAPA